MRQTIVEQLGNETRDAGSEGAVSTTILAIDDEPLALRRLKHLLSSFPAVRQVGEAAGCEEALGKIGTLYPDVILLDVKMRDGTGFDLLERLPSSDAPAVIFVSAFSHHAVRAFEKQAVDYVLKPVDSARLALAIDRARDSLEARHAGERIAELKKIVAALRDGEEEGASERYETEFWIRNRVRGFVRVPVDTIRCVTCEDGYVRLHTSQGSHLMRGSIQSFLRRVDPCLFARIHRKTLVRVACVRQVVKSRSGTQEILLDGGERFRLGRVYAKRFRDLVLLRG